VTAGDLGMIYVGVINVSLLIGIINPFGIADILGFPDTLQNIIVGMTAIMLVLLTDVFGIRSYIWSYFNW
jgi:small-conductance mechanosensitive channel